MSHDPPKSSHADATPGRKVLLAVREGRIDPRLLASARSLCQRMDASLDILLSAGGVELPEAVAAFVGSLRAEGISYSLAHLPALRRRDIVDYANTHECIASVVIDSLEGWESIAREKAGDPWAKLACPLVTAMPIKQSKKAG